MAGTLAMAVAWMIFDWLELEWAKRSNWIVSVPSFGILGVLASVTMYIWWTDAQMLLPPDNSAILRRKRLTRRVGRIFVPIYSFMLSGLMVVAAGGMVFSEPCHSSYAAILVPGSDLP